MQNTNTIKYAEKSFYGPIEVSQFKRDIEERKKWYTLLDIERDRLLKQI
jgi:hypothetical protein